MWWGTTSFTVGIEDAVNDRCRGPGLEGPRRRVALASHCSISTRMTYKAQRSLFSVCAAPSCSDPVRTEVKVLLPRPS